MSDLVARLENMLLIPSPDDSTPQSLHHPQVGVRDTNDIITADVLYHDDDTDEHRYVASLMSVLFPFVVLTNTNSARPTVTRAKHLSRIAVEYNQLLYHAEKASRQDCLFVDQLQKVRGSIVKTPPPIDLTLVLAHRPDKK